MKLSTELRSLLDTEPELNGAVVVAQLPGGPIRQTVMLDIYGRKAVLRADGPLAQRLSLDRNRELDVLQAAASVGFGPAVIRAWPHRGALMTEWVAGEPWSDAEMQHSEQLRRLGMRLRDLHDSGLDMPQVNLRDAICAYAGVRPAREVARMQREALNLLDDLCSGRAALAPCHNDLTANNIIEKQELVFIDWEYGGLCDPLFDLAGVIYQNKLGQLSSEVLLKAYGLPAQRGTRVMRRLAAFFRIYAIVAKLWERARRLASPGTG